MYRGISEVFKIVINGFEQSLEQRDVNGLSSVFHMLEICHTHYCGKRLIDDSTLKKTNETDAKRKSSKGYTARRSSTDERSDSSLIYTRGTYTIIDRVVSFVRSSDTIFLRMNALSISFTIYFDTLKEP